MAATVPVRWPSYAGLVLLLAATAACGTSSDRIIASSPPPTLSPTPTKAATAAPTTTRPPARVEVDEDDSGRTIALRVGQQLRVTLGRQGQQWQPAQSSSAAVVRRSTQGGYPGSEPMVAVFEAQSRGQAQVSASTDLACFHTEPRCLAPQQQWSVTVTVS